VNASHGPPPGVVHTWTTDLLAAAGVRAARAVGAPAFVTPFLHVGQWGADRTSVRTYCRADRVVGLLETEKRQLVELGVPAEKVGVCGACTPPLADPGVRVRDLHRIEGPLVLFVGARRAYKGVDQLLAAAPAVTARIPAATFAFVGPGDPIEAPPGVRAIDAGKVEPAELTAWLSEADLLCLPSRHEIYPTSILEAWSRGTPVLTSDIPTLQELIDRSGGGRTAPRRPAAIAAAILEMLRDPAALREQGRRGEAFWRANGTPEAVAECYLRQYAELTAGAPAPLAAASPAQ
jgi:glycosyltransferase involved in cell wall biosynthesis